MSVAHVADDDDAQDGTHLQRVEYGGGVVVDDLDGVLHVELDGDGEHGGVACFRFSVTEFRQLRMVFLAE